MKSLRMAVSFLTRIPLPDGDWTGRALTRSPVWYPVVGLGVAGGCVLLHVGLARVWPPLTANLLGLVALVAIKDAFHLDGLADFTDGLAGGTDPDARYRIMQDPSLGVMGGLAMLGVTGIEAAVLLPAAPAVYRRALLLTVTLSSAAGGLLLCLGSPRPGTGGLGERLAKTTARGYPTVLLIGSAALALAIDPRAGLVLWGAMVLVVPAFAAFSHRVLGGVTGDGCGALIMLVQGGLLLIFQGIGLAPGGGWT